MTLEVAIFLLIVTVAGIVLALKCLKNKPKLRIICIVVLALLALVLVCYIGLIAIFLYAIQTQPPVP